MTTATLPDVELDDDFDDGPSLADETERLIAAYRRMRRADRRRVARRASPELRAELARVEYDMALKRSPGAMAVTLTEGVEMQAPHLVLIDQLFQRMARGEQVKALITMPPRHGKALALDTPIPTPTGWTNMGDLRVGDQVFDEAGKPCTVTWISPTWHDRPCYDVVTDSGGHIVADAEHEWHASLDRRRQDKLYTTRDLARSRAKQAMIWSAGPLELPAANLLIDPYVLGVWLGDGRSADGGVTAAPEDAKHIRKELHQRGYETVSWSNPTAFGVTGLRAQLRTLGVLNNKHVPAAYLRGSATQRRALLQGLVDTDGYVAKDGQVEFCSTNLGLARAVQELVRTLGGKASLNTGDATLNGRFISKKYRVTFYLKGAALMPRKALNCRSGIRANRHYVAATRRASTATRCIEVDSPSHLFLAGEAMVPTHNSQRAARWAPLWYLAQHPDHRVMIASYGADLAQEHSRWIRDAIKTYGHEIGIALHSGSKAAHRFDLADPITGERLRGGLVAAGVGGGLTGKGAHLAIVDDPIKDAADAESPTLRKRLWSWWTAVINTRLEPTGSILVIQTRWHEQDLAGRLLEGVDADDWIKVDLPAVCDSADDPLGRPIGAALWPSRFNRRTLAKFRRAVGERVWWSLYQQKPRPLEGGVWEWPWITDNRIGPVAFRGVDLSRIVVAVDHAGGGDDVNDETGLVAAGRTTDGHMYVVADKSKRMGADTWGEKACRLALDVDADAIVVEDNFGGDMAKQIVVQAWAKLAADGKTKGRLMPAIIEVTAKKGKRLRAEPIAQLYAQGLVHHVGEHPRLEGQLVTWIPGMDSPDRMDACVHALTELADPAAVPTTGGAYTDQRLAGRR
ncbi:terminase large subunit domain-containing protein [Streptomyces hydrogenans]